MRLLPLQEYMISLCGFSPYTPFEEEDIGVDQLASAHKALVNETGKDFGFDLRAWHEFLLGVEEYTYSYVHESMDSTIEKALNNPEWQLAAKGAAGLKDKSGELKQKVFKGMPDGFEQSRRATLADITTPIIELPTPDGWSRTDLMHLPQGGVGFLVVYTNKNGEQAFFEQLSRELEAIPNDLVSQEIIDELEVTKLEFQDAVDSRLWESAKQQLNKIVSLGDTSVQAQWLRFHVVEDGEEWAQDIYLWTHKNQFLKLHYGQRLPDATTNSQELSVLLTDLGNACLKNTNSKNSND